MDITLTVVSDKGQASVIVDGSVNLIETEFQKQVYEQLGIPKSCQKYPSLNIATSSFDNDLQDGSIVSLHEEVKRSLTGLIYLPLTINEYNCRGILDTGAEEALISLDYVKRLGCEYLIDHTYQGTCKGVGESKLLGKIHNLSIQINGVSYLTQLNVTDMQGYTLLISIEFMRSYNCIINTITNEVIFGNNKVPMLTCSDSEHIKIPVKPDIKDLFIQAKNYHQNPEEFAKLIKVIINNINRYPNDNKYKTINTNQKVKNLLLADKKCENFIKKLGFDLRDTHLSFNGSLETLYPLLTCV
jgi:hypothetical protein